MSICGLCGCAGCICPPSKVGLRPAENAALDGALASKGVDLADARVALERCVSIGPVLRQREIAKCARELLQLVEEDPQFELGIHTWQSPEWAVKIERRTNDAEGKLVAWYSPEKPERGSTADLRTLFAEMSQPDPRLASLPADLAAIASEFLSLHGAWGTRFKAGYGPGVVSLEWDGDDWEASFGITMETGRWRLFFDADSMAHEMTASLPLRRSADFAEFVQRFREVE